MIRRLTALAAVTAFAVAGVTLTVSARHAAQPAHITVTPASADATPPTADELDSIPAPVAAEASAPAPTPAPPAPSTPAAVPVPANRQPAPLPASSVDATPVTVARQTPPTTTPPPATAAPAAGEGPQPANPPVMHRDPRGYCFASGADDSIDTPAEPACPVWTPNGPTPAPAATTTADGEGPQTPTPPVMHRDPEGHCFGAAPGDLPDSPADPTCPIPT